MSPYLPILARAAIVFSGVALFAAKAHAQAYVDAHDFGGFATNSKGQTVSDGAASFSNAKFDKSGNMFGLCSSGGALGYGILWEVTAAGTYIDLHDFGSGNDGKAPERSVNLDSSGNLYGTCAGGGLHSGGTAWEYTTARSYLDLHDFGAGSDGANPYATVTLDSAGNRYGACYSGGQNGCGTIWELTTSGVYKDLHDFGGTIEYSTGALGQDGTNPFGAITFDSAGNMYGTTFVGGAYGGGIVWEETSTHQVYEDIHDFVGGTSGGWNPVAGVALDTLGNLYGTCRNGGAYNKGIAWKIYGNNLQYTHLHDFGGIITNADGDSGSDGGEPEGAVAIDGTGNLYGTCSTAGPSNGYGMVWKIWKNGAYSDLHDFGGPSDGGIPTADVTVDAEGNLYGTCSLAGRTSGGMVWSIALGLTGTDLHWLSLSEAPFTGGQSTTGSVILTGPSPRQGAIVKLTSNTPLASVPASIVVPEGAGWAPFTIQTSTVAHVVNATITASYEGVSKPATLTINPPAVTSVSISGSSWIGGASSTATVTVNEAAPQGGLIVTLTSSNSCAKVPGTVTIPANKTTANFTITTVEVGIQESATISASTAGGSAGAYLGIYPPPVSGFTLNPTTVMGGRPVTATVTVAEAAPQGGIPVTVAGYSGAPASVTIPNGKTTATFTVSTSGVTAVTSATIGASTASGALNAMFTIDPPAGPGLSLNPSTVLDTKPSIATVTLPTAAPAGGLTVFLACSPSIASFPSQITVPAGQKTATFTVNPYGVNNAQSVTIYAWTQGGSYEADAVLTIAKMTITLNPATVIGGNPSTATLILDSPAPPSGYPVPLASYSVNVPATVLVPGGKTTATFNVETFVVGILETATIYANLTSSGKYAGFGVLTVDPPAVTGLTLNPVVVLGGSPSTATLTISMVSPAPPWGVVVSLKSSDSSASVPATVTVAGGQTTATFTVNTVKVSGTTDVTITASTAGGASAAVLEIRRSLIHIG